MIVDRVDRISETMGPITRWSGLPGFGGVRTEAGPKAGARPLPGGRVVRVAELSPEAEAWLLANSYRSAADIQRGDLDSIPDDLIPELMEAWRVESNHDAHRLTDVEVACRVGCTSPCTNPICHSVCCWVE